MEGVKNLDSSSQESWVFGEWYVYTAVNGTGETLPFTLNSIKDEHISAVYAIVCRKEVGGGNNTNAKQDNKTCFREGSRFMKEVRVDAA